MGKIYKLSWLEMGDHALFLFLFFLFNFFFQGGHHVPYIVIYHSPKRGTWGGRFYVSNPFFFFPSSFEKCLLIIIHTNIIHLFIHLFMHSFILLHTRTRIDIIVKYIYPVCIYFNIPQSS